MLPLDNATMQQISPDKKDRKTMYEGMWLTWGMLNVDLSTFEGGTWTFERGRNNMDIILGKKMVNNLPFDSLYDRPESVKEVYALPCVS